MVASGGNRLSYRALVEGFSWESIIARSDWPAAQKYNLAHELCDRWAQIPAKANAPALRYELKDGTSGSYTFSQLRELSNRFANVLRALGIGKGDRVAGLLPRIPAILPAILGIWKVGAVYVPLFTAFAAPAVAYRLRKSESSAVITDEDNLAKVLASQETTEGLPALEHTIVVADPAKALDAGVINFWTELNRASDQFQVVETTLDDLETILYTSGSTGQPKGAMTPHKLGLQILVYVLYGLALRADDVFWSPADPGWAYGLHIGLIGPLLVGKATTLVEAPFAPERCWQVIERLGVTNFAAAPTAYRALMAAGAELAHQYKCRLRVASSAGEPLNPEVIDWFKRELDVPVYDQYGQTELAMVICNCHAVSDLIKPGSMGRPLPGFEIGLVDSEGHEVPTNTPGQIALKRTSYSHTFKGYWREPEKSAAIYQGEWYLSGDMARRDADGYFWFEGRSDDLINTSAYRIGPFEIESALLKHPAVTEAAVIGVADTQRGEVIKAYVTVQPGSETGSAFVEALQQIVREQVGKHAIPRQVEVVDSLPKTSSGKIQRYVLRQQNQ